MVNLAFVWFDSFTGDNVTKVGKLFLYEMTLLSFQL